MAPAGLAVVAVRLYREGVGRANPSAYGFTDEQLAELVEITEHAGLARATVHRREWPRETIGAVVAHA